MSSVDNRAECLQPAVFEFTAENLSAAQDILKRYPPQNKRSAVMPLLYLAQKQNGNWVPKAAMDCIAKMLEIPAMYVYEVANFYTMYNTKPIGRHLIQICSTTPCWLRGSDLISETCQRKLGITIGETTQDQKFTIVEVECLGACVNAPIVQINNDYYENLTPSAMEQIIDTLKDNK
jgi:NADH-quinone oxidoreductase subunit E